MPDPLALATWNFGPTATVAAWDVLQKNHPSLDAVEAGCVAVEDDPQVHTVGLGGLPDRSGQPSLDGSIMAGPNRCGSVSFVRRFNHPVSLARCVMEKTDHRMLSGQGAEAFAEAMGFEPQNLLTDSAQKRWETWSKDHPQAVTDPTCAWVNRANLEQEPAADPNAYHDTVGVLSLDRHGRLAGACSTSGLPFKVPGRVGDSPIIGSGLYVHPEHGAAVATGTGELVMGLCSTFAAVHAMRLGSPPLEALAAALAEIIRHHDLEPHHQVGMIALRPDGTWASASLREGFSVAVTDKQGTRLTDPQQTML